MDYSLLFPGRFLKSAQFKGKDVTLTIRSVRIEELEGDKGKETKGIVGFEKTPLELVLNRTNAEALKHLFGRETDGWLGKRVTFYPAPYHDNTTGEDSTCIRVRGSPDISADITYALKLARKKPVNVTLKRTGQAPAKANGKPTAPPPPTPEPKVADPAEMTPEEMQEIVDRENAEAQGGGL